MISGAIIMTPLGSNVIYGKNILHLFSAFTVLKEYKKRQLKEMCHLVFLDAI